MGIVFAFPSNPELRASNTSVSLTVKVEKWRCIAYINFWLMCALAVVMSKLFVVDILAAGPDPSLPLEQKGCGPFNRQDTGFGVGLGQPFDFATENHLTELFGFPNICTYWDYSPSREITGLFFPFFEYALAVYLTLDIVNTRLSFQRGELPQWFWSWSKFVYAVSLLLCIWFRMIFVFIAYDNPQGHTAAFLGLQIALILVALQNTMYVLMTGQSYPTINLSAEKTKMVGITYLVLLLGISSIKVWASCYIVANGVGPDFYKKESFIPGLVTGKLVDYVWMLFNAIIPFVIALVRSKNEDSLHLEVTCPKPAYRDASGEVDPIVSKA